MDQSNLCRLNEYTEYSMKMLCSFFFNICIANGRKRISLYKIKNGISTVFFSGAKEDRTPDPLLAKQVLSQLSYNPVYITMNKVVGLNGLEPTTSPLSGVRSNHLSYRPVFIECLNIIPTTYILVNNFFEKFFTECWRIICNARKEKTLMLLKP